MRDYVAYLDPENALFTTKDITNDDLADWIVGTDEGNELVYNYILEDPYLVKEILKSGLSTQTHWIRTEKQFSQYGRSFAGEVDDLIIKLVEENYDEIYEHYQSYMLQNMQTLR